MLADYGGLKNFTHTHLNYQITQTGHQPSRQTQKKLCYVPSFYPR